MGYHYKICDICVICESKKFSQITQMSQKFMGIAGAGNSQIAWWTANYLAGARRMRRPSRTSSSWLMR